MEDQIFKVRYSVEPWNKPVPNIENSKLESPGIRTVSDKYGYTDVLFLASCLQDDDGNIDSILILSSEDSSKPRPSRELLEAVRDQINHHLEHHCQ